MYVSFIFAYQFRQYSQSFYRGIQKSLSQTWNWITILFKSAVQVVDKAIEKNVAKAQEVIRKQRNKDYYWIASHVTYGRKNIRKTTYFPCMPITKS